MLYLITFITGICLGLMAALVVYFFREWYPLIKHLRLPDVEDERDPAKLTPEEQYRELLSWQPKVRDND